MNPGHHKVRNSVAAILALLMSLVASPQAIGAASAQDTPAAASGTPSKYRSEPMHGMPPTAGPRRTQQAPAMPDLQSMQRTHTRAPAAGRSGQDAFGAIQEIVRVLESDPSTDWSKVDLEALRQHLIDMNEVTLRAGAASTVVDGGVAIKVTGTGRTLPAIQRMVPAHAKEIDGLDGWTAKAEPIADGVLMTVTARDPKQVARIRGLGFGGILVTGSHHPVHHLAIAKGELPHSH